MVRVSSRASVIVKEWNIEPKQVRDLPDGWEDNPVFQRLLDGGFIWFADSLGYRIDRPMDLPKLKPAVEPEPIKEEEPKEEPKEELGEEPVIDDSIASDYLERNARTVLKNLRSDELGGDFLEALLKAEKARDNPRKSILFKLESMLE